MRTLALALALSLALAGCKKKEEPPPAPAPAPATEGAKPAAAAEPTAAPTPKGMKLHLDAKHGFQVAVPEEWETDLTDENFTIQFKDKDEHAIWGISVADYPEPIAAKELAVEIEKNLEMKNQFDEKQSTLEKKQLVRANADDGRVALFNMGEGDEEVTQRLWVFTKAKHSYVLTETGLADADYPERVEVFDKMVDSFRIH